MSDKPELPTNIKFELPKPENNWKSGFKKYIGNQIYTNVASFQPDELRSIANYIEWLQENTTKEK